MIYQDYEKMKIALRYRLLGMRYFNAVAAMDFAEKLHNGVRKDGQPEFSHQVSQASYAITMVNLMLFPEETICVIFLHDTVEDYDVTKEELVRRFGIVVAEATIRMSKVINGVKTPNEVYYPGMECCPIASAAKGFDRVHNLMTMVGGFTPAKQESYLVETMDFVIPMIKSARRVFPKQEMVYENIKFVMTNQITLYNALISQRKEVSK